MSWLLITSLSFFTHQKVAWWALIPAGVLIGFESEDDWFDFRLEHDARFLARVAGARASLRRGRGIKIEDIGDDT